MVFWKLIQNIVVSEWVLPLYDEAAILWDTFRRTKCEMSGIKGILRQKKTYFHLIIYYVLEYSKFT